jgi:hypothetical protein
MNFCYFCFLYVHHRWTNYAGQMYLPKQNWLSHKRILDTAYSYKTYHGTNCYNGNIQGGILARLSSILTETYDFPQSTHINSGIVPQTGTTISFQILIYSYYMTISPFNLKLYNLRSFSIYLCFTVYEETNYAT